MPPYGWNNERPRIAAGQLCFLTQGAQRCDAPDCEAIDYDGHARPGAALHASRRRWGHLVLTEKGWRYEARWRGDDSPAAPVRVILLETAN